VGGRILGADIAYLALAALRNRNSSLIIDGEAVLLGVDGRSSFPYTSARTTSPDFSPGRVDSILLVVALNDRR
jgi:hypothetical protein